MTLYDSLPTIDASRVIVSCSIRLSQPGVMFETLSRFTSSWSNLSVLVVPCFLLLKNFFSFIFFCLVVIRMVFVTSFLGCDHRKIH